MIKLDDLKRNRNYWLDNTKFFLIFLVVIGHFLEPLINNNKIINYVYNFIYVFHMPLFIFITGFFSKNINNSKKRILTYFILYIIMQSIELLITNQKFSMVNAEFALWYLQAIIAYNLILPIINKSNSKVVIILSLIIGLIIGFDDRAGHLASLSRIFVMLPFFIMGYFTSEKQLYKLKNKKDIIFAILFLIILIIIIPIATDKIKNLSGLLQGKFSYNNMKMGAIGILYRLFWYIIAAITSFAILTIIPKRKLPCISKFGTRTLQVYCLHILVILVLKNFNIFEKIDNIKEFMYLLLFAVALVPTLSLKIFWYPFNFIIKLVEKITNKEIKNVKQASNEYET